MAEKPGNRFTAPQWHVQRKLQSIMNAPQSRNRGSAQDKTAFVADEIGYAAEIMRRDDVASTRHALRSESGS